MNQDLKFAFFGTDQFATIVLDELKKAGFLPKVIISAPDKPQGRKLKLTPPPAKIWAEENNIEILQPENLKTISQRLINLDCQVFLVASFGKIIPQEILDIPRFKTLNVHPSLLPKLRGPAPIEGAILHEQKTGVTIMRLNSKMDEGPIVVQKESEIILPIRRDFLEERLAHEGGMLLAEVLPKWISGEINEKEQDHAKATYTKIIEKKDGLIDISQNPEKNYKKVFAYFGWPGAYYFAKNKNGEDVRTIITEAKLENKEFKILRVKPEGKNEMPYEDFLRGL